MSGKLLEVLFWLLCDVARRYICVWMKRERKQKVVCPELIFGGKHHALEWSLMFFKGSSVLKENLVNKMHTLWGTAIVTPNVAIYCHKLFSQFLQKNILDWKRIKDERRKLRVSPEFCYWLSMVSSLLNISFLNWHSIICTFFLSISCVHLVLFCSATRMWHKWARMKHTQIISVW